MQFLTQHTLSFKLICAATCYPSGMGACHFWLIQFNLNWISQCYQLDQPFSFLRSVASDLGLRCVFMSHNKAYMG